MLRSCIVALFTFCLASAAQAQTTTFTYQGRLADGSGSVTDPTDFEFRLYDAATSGSQVGSTIAVNAAGVTNGLFTVALDFGGAAFDGAARWLEIEVRPGAGSGAFTKLAPRQLITSAPYAVRAGTASGLPAGVVTSTMLADGAVTSGKIATSAVDGPALNNSAVSASKLASGAVTGLKLATDAVTSDKIADGTITDADVLPAMFNNTFWRVGGNLVSSSAGNYHLGHNSNLPLELWANGRPALRLQSSADALINIVGGWASNEVASGVHGVTIAGGGRRWFGASYPHVVGADGGTIGGGAGGQIDFGAEFATVAGGLTNRISGGAGYATIGGGGGNLALVNAGYATIPGGFQNSAADRAFAAGNRAKAVHPGAFVWSDTQTADFASTGDNQFNVRAAGGARFVTSGAGLSVDGGQVARENRANTFAAGQAVASGSGLPQLQLTQTAPGDFSRLRFSANQSPLWDIASGGSGNVLNFYYIPTGANRMTVDAAGNLFITGTLNPPSDRNLKQDFAMVDAQAVLAKVAALSLQSWSYTNRPGVKHVGPMAQDFHAAFGLGESDKHIATVDADGVALAAIQGLNQKLETEAKLKDARIAELEKRLAIIESFLLK